VVHLQRCGGEHGARDELFELFGVSVARNGPATITRLRSRRGGPTFCRSDDRLELSAIRPATKPASPADLATVLRDGRSRRAEAAIRSLRVLRRNSIYFLRVEMLSGAGPAPFYRMALP
jgi:hypothetical protein